MGAADVAVKGGDKITRVLQSIGSKLNRANHVNVGFLSSAKYQATVHKPRQGGLPVAQVAFWDEFGTVHSPPRPFFRQMIAANSAAWPAQLAKALKLMGFDSAKALALMGGKMQRELQDSIRGGDFAAPSPVTLMLRRMADDDPSLVITRRTVGEASRRVAAGEQGAAGARAQALQDSLVMIQSVGFEVKST
jgi:hypothetical protein